MWLIFFVSILTQNYQLHLLLEVYEKIPMLLTGNSKPEKDALKCRKLLNDIRYIFFIYIQEILLPLYVSMTSCGVKVQRFPGCIWWKYIFYTTNNIIMNLFTKWCAKRFYHNISRYFLIMLRFSSSDQTTSLFRTDGACCQKTANIVSSDLVGLLCANIHTHFFSFLVNLP